MKEERRKSENWKEEKVPQSGTKAVLEILAVLSFVIAVYQGITANPETSIHQIYFVIVQIKYILYSIMFLVAAKVF